MHLVVLVVKNPLANAGDIRDVGSIPGSGRSPREGRGNPLQYSCLENPMDRGPWQATVHGVANESYKTETTPWTAAYQAPPSMGFSRQDYWRNIPSKGIHSIFMNSSSGNAL